MKTYKNLFNNISCFENLHLAYLKARMSKRYRKQVLEFSDNLEENLLKLEQELSNQSYQHGGYREFIVCDAKKRNIKAAPFRDRVVHHAVYNIIEPIFDKGFIYDSYACRREKGTHKAIKRLKKFLKSAKDKRKHLGASKVYCFQSDISKYFVSIDHNILISLFAKKIKDEKVLWLLEEIIKSTYEHKIFENLFEFKLAGIPIGNLTSQLFANLYLNELDQFIKHNLKKEYYIRYMDDFLILGYDKKELHQIKEEIREFLKDRLKLKLHPKKINISPVDTGIVFLGYQIFGTHRLLRKSTIKRFIKRTKFYKKQVFKGKMKQEKLDSSLQSWFAYAEFGNTYFLVKQLKVKFHSF